MNNYPKPVTKETHKKIMNYFDNSLYKIKIKDGKNGIGFFCYIKPQNKIIAALVTNYQIIDEKFYSNNNMIKVLLKEKLIPIEFGNIYYINKDLNISIIEIKENKLINILDIDDNIYKKNSEKYLSKDSIYIIHYNNDTCVSYGIINNLNNNELFISCIINSDSNCYPIFNLSTNKLFWYIPKKSNHHYKGIYFKYLIDKLGFIYNKNYLINEISILVNVTKNDIGKKIYFLDNEYIENDLPNSSHNNLIELNELNTEIYINKKKENYKKYFIPNNDGIYNINIKFNINLTDCSYMFAG